MSYFKINHPDIFINEFGGGNGHIQSFRELWRQTDPERQIYYSFKHPYPELMAQDTDCLKVYGYIRYSQIGLIEELVKAHKVKGFVHVSGLNKDELIRHEESYIVLTPTLVINEFPNKGILDADILVIQPGAGMLEEITPTHAKIILAAPAHTEQAINAVWYERSHRGRILSQYHEPDVINAERISKFLKEPQWNYPGCFS